MRGGGELVGRSGTLRRKGIVQERKNTTTIIKKNPTLPGSFYMIMLRTIELVGRAALRTLRGASPLETWSDAFTPHSGTKAGK